MTMSAFVDKKRFRSSLGDDSAEETSRRGGGSVEGEGPRAKSEGEWLASGCADKKTEKTACICVASSLHGMN
jgi:hypothetical protein